MIIRREDLYEYLRHNCLGGYSVGLHGIDLDRYKNIYQRDGIYDEAIDSIVNSGLKVHSGRSVNGTVRFFGRLDSRDDMEKVFLGLSNYSYSGNTYIIVAIPTELEDSNGNKLFVGKTNLDSNFKNPFETRGEEVTSLVDSVILDNQVLPKEFILGSFKVVDLDNQIIDVEINPNHVAFKNNIVSDERFEKCKKKFENLCNFLGANWLVDLLEGKSDYTDIERFIGFEGYYYLLETIRQYKFEKDNLDLFDDDFDKLEELKAQYRDRVEMYKKERRERELLFNSTKNYAVKELGESLVNNLTLMNKYPEEVTNNILLMREIVKTKGISSALMYYVGEDVQNDLVFHLNLLKYGSFNPVDYASIEEERNIYDDFYNTSLEISDFSNTHVGLDVRAQRVFWEMLNKKLASLGYGYPFYDIDKEVRIAVEEIESSNRRGSK